MYCSTCGAYIPAGRTECSECGTSTGLPAAHPQSAVGPPERASTQSLADRQLGECPRCHYRGEGISYFSRGGHIALLVMLTLFTAGAMGMGGLIYYLVRRDHRVCPRCGKSWGKYGELGLLPARESTPATAGTPRLAGGGESAYRGWSIFLFALAAMLLIVGIVEVEALAALLGGLAGSGGWLLHRAANQAREARRAALLANLQLPVLELAARRGGRLTVTEVASAMGWTLPRAEKVLNSLDDGLRVDSEVTDEGVIVYEFRELLPTLRNSAARRRVPPAAGPAPAENPHPLGPNPRDRQIPPGPPLPKGGTTAPQ